MALINGREVSTVECGKELAAREKKPGAFVDFLGWIGRKGWRFCHLTPGERFYPVTDQLVMRLLPDPPDGGSQELGDWLNDLPDLELCFHRESNADEVLAHIKSENDGAIPSEYFPFWPLDHDDYWPAGWYPVRTRIEDLLADYFGIDLVQSSRERQAILDALQSMPGL